jgi:hypothetical protein
MAGKGIYMWKWAALCHKYMTPRLLLLLVMVVVVVVVVMRVVGCCFVGAVKVGICGMPTA